MIYISLFIYIYIYRERERDTHTHTHTHRFPREVCYLPASAWGWMKPLEPQD